MKEIKGNKKQNSVSTMNLPRLKGHKTKDFHDLYKQPSNNLHLEKMSTEHFCNCSSHSNHSLGQDTQRTRIKIKNVQPQ